MTRVKMAERVKKITTMQFTIVRVRTATLEMTVSLVRLAHYTSVVIVV